MNSRNFSKLFTLSIFLFLLFIWLGPFVLPEPMRTTSWKTRTSVNNFLTGLIPNWNPKNPNERTEDAIQKQQEGKPAPTK